MARRENYIVGYSILIILISMGTRQTFGIYLQPVTDELGIGRELFSLALAIQSIIGGLPLAGILSDRYGSRWVAIGGGLLFAVSMYLMSITTHWTSLMLGFGLLSGVSLSSVSYVVVLGAVAQVVPPERRSRTFGFITAAGSIGMFIVVPVAQHILNAYGWRTTFAIFAGFVGLIALLAAGYPTRKQQVTGSESTAGAFRFAHSGAGESKPSFGLLAADYRLFLSAASTFRMLRRTYPPISLITDYQVQPGRLPSRWWGCLIYLVLRSLVT